MDAGKAPLLVPQQSPQPILEPTLSASRRWATLGCSVLVMGVSGTVYSYGSIEVALKADLGLNDAVGSTLGLLCNFGACVCPHIGWLVDRASVRTTACLAALLLGVTFGVEGLAVHHGWNSPYLLGVLLLLQGQGSGLGYMTALSTFKNWPEAHRGKVVGLMDAMFGFSAAIFSLIYGGLFNGNAVAKKQDLSSYLFFCAAVGFGANFALSLVGQVQDAEEHAAEDVLLLKA